MGVYPAQPYRRVVYATGDTQCIETRCPNCRKAIFWIVRTQEIGGRFAFTIWENDRECVCNLNERDREWLELVAIEESPNDTEDEDWHSLPHKASAFANEESGE